MTTQLSARRNMTYIVFLSTEGGLNVNIGHIAYTNVTNWHFIGLNICSRKLKVKGSHSFQDSLWLFIVSMIKETCTRNLLSCSSLQKIDIQDVIMLLSQLNTRWRLHWTLCISLGARRSYSLLLNYHDPRFTFPSTYFNTIHFILNMITINCVRCITWTKNNAGGPVALWHEASFDSALFVASDRGQVLYWIIKPPPQPLHLNLIARLKAAF